MYIHTFMRFYTEDFDSYAAMLNDQRIRSRHIFPALCLTLTAEPRHHAKTCPEGSQTACCQCCPTSDGQEVRMTENHAGSAMSAVENPAKTSNVDITIINDSPNHRRLLV